MPRMAAAKVSGSTVITMVNTAPTVPISNQNSASTTHTIGGMPSKMLISGRQNSASVLNEPASSPSPMPNASASAMPLPARYSVGTISAASKSDSKSSALANTGSGAGSTKSPKLPAASCHSAQNTATAAAEANPPHR